jgi:two-component system response regulator CpxR
MADILVIDDNQHVRRLVERILTAAGHTVTEAQGGSEGLAAFRRAPPAMVITDIVMEYGEGIETIRALRREAPAMPILAMSGSGTHYLYAAGRPGASATIEKPFRLHELTATVNRLLGETTANW